MNPVSFRSLHPISKGGVISGVAVVVLAVLTIALVGGTPIRSKVSCKNWPIHDKSAKIRSRTRSFKMDWSDDSWRSWLDFDQLFIALSDGVLL